ncbi:protein of unknown function (DUF222) [Williamsia serinedens]|uniref:DUF222 domain-containing protein n=1 Tax=Williamsia serinedens TaxID=391736 RepID=A0ABT1GXZ7_9NOCA|nr:protein of unknown function (DUF222) [Williamsia serinedens]
MAASVHTADPRTRAQRRADALIALAAGTDHLTCGCDTCTQPVELEPDTDTHVDVDATVDPAPAVEQPAPQPIAPPVGPARPVFHIVVNLSTLLGLDDQPGYLDGRGIIDADTMRALLADAEREFLRRDDPATAARAASIYTPSKKLQALVRAGELCCTFPGCSAPAWSVDLDHTDPFDHRDPDHGGQTTRANLKPLCRFHHRIKTFDKRWRDYQSPLGEAFFHSPTGHMFLGNAYNAHDIFPALGPPEKPENHPARTTLAARRAQKRAAHLRAVERAEAADPPPF